MAKSIFLIATTLVLVIKAHPPKCFLPVSQGTDTNCPNTPSQRYHFDPSLNQCHAFQYKGCGGNLNNYQTPGDCEETCDVNTKDYIRCPLGTNPVFSNHNNRCPMNDADTGEGCESDEAICVQFTSMALCCQRNVVLGLQEDKSATCPSGNSRWQVNGTTVLAKDCDDITCPSGYSCNKGNFFSYCCANESILL